jgi:hypothetical protein
MKMASFYGSQWLLSSRNVVILKSLTFLSVIRLIYVLNTKIYGYSQHDCRQLSRARYLVISTPTILASNVYISRRSVKEWNYVN